VTEIGWGFIGASGWAERWIVPAVQAVDGARAVGVFSSSLERGERFARKVGLERAYSSLEALLADPAIDAVYVSTTNELHAAQTIAAARAGKHVLCEKPLATTYEDALMMLQACREAGVVMGTNHHYRGSPTLKAIRELVASGEIGDVIAARTFHAVSLPETMRTWRVDRPEAGAGVVLDITVHDADTIRFLLADEVAEVTAMTANDGLGVGSIEDSVMGVMRMDGGPLVSFHASFTVAHAGTGVEVHGTTGSLIGRDLLSASPSGDLFLRRIDDVEQIEIPVRWPLYELAIRRFGDAIRGEGEPLTTGEDGIASLAVALATLESAREGRTAVPRRQT
jgi:1,5-anhydro-D-fructose reductase (1,5-anhydro-D-mannitol-forming)